MTVVTRALPAAALALSVSLSLALPAHADTREERLALAQEYTALTVEDMDIERVIAQMYQPVLSQIESVRGEALSPEKLEQIHTIYMAELYEPMREIMLAQSEIMADIYTLEEIDALYAFYKSDLGRSAMLKLPQLLEVQQPMVLGMVQARMPNLMERLRLIIED